MKTSMLEYSKIILTKVSFCERLFEKELKKAILILSDKERFYLQLWCNTEFGATYCRLINKCFKRRFLLLGPQGDMLKKEQCSLT
jgi:hypothetical protein